MSSGYTLKLDLSNFQHDVLVDVLAKHGTGDQDKDDALQEILQQITGYDEAVAAAKEYNRQREEEGWQ